MTQGSFSNGQLNRDDNLTMFLVRMRYTDFRSEMMC